MVTHQVKEAFRSTLFAALVAGILVVVDLLNMDGLIRFVLERPIKVVMGFNQQFVRLIVQPVDLVNYWQNGNWRIADLETRLAQIVVDQNRLAQLEIENVQLRQQLGFNQNDQKHLLMVQSIAQSQELLIDAGSEKGLQTGMLVLDTKGILVGKVGKVGVYTAQVLRPSSSNLAITVAIRTSGVRGVLKGTGDGARVEEILQADVLSSGDVLITSGEDDLFPPGLIVGQVDKLILIDSAVTKQATVRLLANPNEGMFVVLRGEK